jgi:hypothetical protein
MDGEFNTASDKVPGLIDDTVVAPETTSCVSLLRRDLVVTERGIGPEVGHPAVQLGAGTAPELECHAKPV